MEHPMPRLKNHSQIIASWIGHLKSKIPTSSRQPIKCRRLFEFFGDGRKPRRANINGASRVMLAESRQRAHANNLFNRQSGGELPLDNLPLIIKAAEAGDRHQYDSFLLAGLKHSLPM